MGKSVGSGSSRALGARERKSLARAMVREKWRLRVIELHRQGLSTSQIAREVPYSKDRVFYWVQEWLVFGNEALKVNTSNRSWPLATRIEAVQAFLAGESVYSVMRRYDIRKRTYVYAWVKKLEGEEALMDRKKQGEGYENDDGSPGFSNSLLAEKEFLEAAEASWQLVQQFDPAWTDAWIEAQMKFQVLISKQVDMAGVNRCMEIQTQIIKKLLPLASLMREAGRIDGIMMILAEVKGMLPMSSLLYLFGLSSSTYYHRLKNGAPRVDEELEQRVLNIFNDYDGRYGCRRIAMVIREGLDDDPPMRISVKRVHKIMRKLDIKGKQVRRGRYNSFKGGDRTAINRLEQNFAVSQARKVLVTDITMFSIAGKRLYFSPLTDIWNNEIIAWRISDSPTAQMTCDMLEEGLRQIENPQGIIVHTDQGTQYTSTQWKALLSQYGVLRSMSRVGNCYDNAPAESLFARIKTEMPPETTYATTQEFIQDLTEYVDWWNNKRIITRLGTSPRGYLQKQTCN